MTTQKTPCGHSGDGLPTDQVEPGYWRVENGPENAYGGYMRAAPDLAWRPVVWGLSFYDTDGSGPTWEYRTLGIYFEDVISRWPDARWFPDHDRRAELARPAAAYVSVSMDEFAEFLQQTPIAEAWARDLEDRTHDLEGRSHTFSDHRCARVFGDIHAIDQELHDLKNVVTAAHQALDESGVPTRTNRQNPYSVRPVGPLSLAERIQLLSLRCIEKLKFDPEIHGNKYVTTAEMPAAKGYGIRPPKDPEEQP